MGVGELTHVLGVQMHPAPGRFRAYGPCMTTSQAPRRMDFPAAHGRSAVKGWLAVLAVTLGVFSLMTSELLPVGLLTPIGTALDVSGGTAGLMVTVPGLVAAVSAPLVTVATGRTDRRIVLVVLMGPAPGAGQACRPDHRRHLRRWRLGPAVALSCSRPGGPASRC